MLKSLSIHNFILIESVELAFNKGFTVITGETGSGKSIIIDALLCCLGERISSDMLRTGTQKGYIEACFEIGDYPHILEALVSNDYECDQILILRKEFNAKGISRCFINDSPANLAFVKSIAMLLVDFHGQHENQIVLKAENHVEILDALSDNTSIKQQYHLSWNLLRNSIHAYQQLKNQELQLLDRQEYSSFQLKEIEDISPKPDELESLEKELSIIQHAEQLFESSDSLYALLYESETSIHDSLTKAQSLLQQLSSFDNTFKQYLDECTMALASIVEIASFTSRYSASIDSNVHNINTIQERLSLLFRLKKKYGTFENVFSVWEELKDELRISSNFEEELASKVNDILALKSHISTYALLLSKSRNIATISICESIEYILKTIGIEHPSFVIKIQSIPVEHHQIDTLTVEIDGQFFKAGNTGIDTIEFMVSTNSGEDPKSLFKVASGGEISRIMLAIKSIMADFDQIPLLIFDEIDTGISGRIAQKVGFLMKGIGLKRQVIAISHSPQIAALADNHILISKQVDVHNTYIKAHQLSQEEKIQQIASLLSGNTITVTSVDHAMELMQSVNKSNTHPQQS